MVTRPPYAITIRNTETPLPSLLVTSWRRVGQPKMCILFGRDVTLALSCNIQSPNEGNTSWPSNSKNANRNRRTPKTPLLPPIIFKTLTDSRSSTQKKPRTSNFGPVPRAGHRPRCGKLEPRKLIPAFHRKAPTPLHNTCKSSNATYVVPDLDDVPLLLRNLTIEDQRLFSPFDIHCGHYVCMFNGYRQRTGPFRILWCKQIVQQKICFVED